MTACSLQPPQYEQETCRYVACWRARPTTGCLLLDRAPSEGALGFGFGFMTLDFAASILYTLAMNKSSADPSPSRSPLWGRFLLLALLAALVAAVTLAYLRARYEWRDVFVLFHRVGGHLSRQRLAAALLALGGVVWLTARSRASRLAAYPALLAYAAGVLADLTVLLTLEPLGISHGPVLLPLAFLAGARCILAVSLALAALVAGRGGRRAPLWPALHVAGQLLIVALVVYSFALEPMRLTVSRVPVADPAQGAPAERAVRIVQLSDLHLERANGLTRRIVAAVNGLEPDLILLTGDYFSTSFAYDARARADLLEMLASLQARHGLYAVLGNVDPPSVAELLAGEPTINLLTDEWAMVEVEGRRLAIAGVSQHHGPAGERGLDRSRAALARLQETMPDDRFSILLFHSPNLVPEAAAAGFDLYATGHTHGGQIRLPFYGALTTFSLYGKRYEMGRYQEQGMVVYVSRGIGMEGWLVPRMRFLCPPEIVCYEVR